MIDKEKTKMKKAREAIGEESPSKVIPLRHPKKKKKQPEGSFSDALSFEAVRRANLANMPSM